jgi:hypothetical protein
MKILYVTSNIPSKSAEAVERVNLEIINQLSNKGFKIYVQIIFSEFITPDKEIDYKIIKDLNNDIKFLPALYTKNSFNKLTTYIKILFPTKKNIYPSFIHKKKIEEIIKKEKIDLIFQSWDYPGLVAVNEIKNVKKILYYGQPDHKPNLIRLADRHIFYSKKKPFFRLRKFLIERFNNKKEKIHISMVKNFDEVHIICKATQLDYVNAGVKKAQYTQNIWPLLENYKSEPIKNKICKIVGSVGSNDATGNTVNFFYIGDKLLKHLNSMINFEFEMNFYGKNQPLGNVLKLFNQNNVRFKGWVEDLDFEVKSSDIFLICHNSIYKERYIICNKNKWQLGGSHTRFLYAWSLGCPIVTHSMNKKFMPELEHNYNVLMGDNEVELSNLLYELYHNIELRKKIILNGKRTLKKYFLPEIVVSKLLNI